mmetsp:Transcript_23392/g.64909  ORF Transcript_23392/g.64909 Transcript_23392/m.64909 type:complete len:282 (-) Transcript_23392:199-1044(-)
MDDIAGLKPHEEITSPPWGEIGRSFTLGVVSLFSKTLLNVANATEIHNEERIKQYITERDRGSGLLTVCNHTSTFDDPGVLSAILPWSFFLSEYQHKGVRWTMCAKEICYSNWALSQFFRNGKVLPVDRKGGVHQPTMQVVGELLGKGDWVHLFPEGRVSFSGKMIPFRRGVGKLVCDYVGHTGSPPVVLPFYHSGMGEVKPKHKMMIFSVGKKVDVVIGEPIEIPQELCDQCRKANADHSKAWKQITDVIEVALKDMEKAARPNVDQTQKQTETPNVATA